MSIADQRPREPGLTPLRQALRKCYPALWGVGLFSGLINVLALTGSLYMLQVYDRVLTSGSVPTLIVLTIAMVGLFAAYGLLDWVRQRILVRVGNRFDTTLHEQVFDAQLAIPLRAGHDGNRVQPISDLDTIRGFLSGAGLTAFFDVPWLPFYMIIVYYLHPWLGILATVGAIITIAITLVAEGMTRGPARKATESVIARRIYGDAGRRNAEVVRALGLSERIGAIWSNYSTRYLEDQRNISDIVGASGVISRTLRMILQSLILGLGAYIVLRGEATGGIIIASSILTARALAPIDIVIANWRGFMAARQSWTKLNNVLSNLRIRQEAMQLPRPRKVLQVEDIAVAAPGSQKVIVQGVSFSLQAGNGLGIIGPSASGKSSLVRAMVGVWAPGRGKVRLDGAALEQYDPSDLGRDIGYLPQDIELFDGTVADNISRFAENPDATTVLNAAEAAGVHQMILRLPDGYHTRVGEGGVALSAGQRQLVGLARALYGDPFLVVLDEPNSNLDADGDTALANAIRSVRARGGIAVVVAHRPSALVNIDQLLYMANGAMQAFGPRDEVLAKVTQASQQAAQAGQARPDQAAQPSRQESIPAKAASTTVIPLHERRP
ncbi:MAG TPA: type I secretion system permease/ATPase [Mesorhizobium sp.]